MLPLKIQELISAYVKYRDLKSVVREKNQYQIYHRIVGSFLNEKSASLGINALSTYTLSGSNGSGTLYATILAQLPEELSDEERELFERLKKLRNGAISATEPPPN